MSRSVGVLAIQGDFEKHIEAFAKAGASNVFEVRTQADLEAAGRLVIPGGESTTVGKLLERFGLGELIRSRAKDGMPVWGTCMGMIVMAKTIRDSDQYSLGLLDITVQRNAFGSQTHSFEDSVEFAELTDPITGVFIRAPIVTELGDGVEPLATYDGKVVAVRQGNCVGTSFHPELTDDVQVHEWFLSL